MAIYDKERVDNNRGLTVTSQRKYVIFYEKLWRDIWGVKGNIGDVPAEKVPGETWKVPPQPQFQLVGVEVIGANAGVLKNISIHVYKGTNLTPEHLATSKSTSETQTVFSDINCTIEGNFKIRVDHATSGLFGKKAKALEMWHNTLFIEKGVPSMDFPLNQLDIKRKLIKKFGEGITLRLKFSNDNNRSTSSVANSSPTATEGVQLIVHESTIAADGDKV
jgi:hypothetical protein